MQLNHSTKVLNFEGKPIPQWDTDDTGQPIRGDDGRLVSKGDLTMRDVAIMALNGQDPNENIGAELKSRLFALTMKFYKGKKIHLTTEEGSLLKERAGKTLSTLAYGRLCEWVEGETPSIPDVDTDDQYDGDDGETGDEQPPAVKAKVRRIRDNPQA